jgi:hypothetical protein
MSRTRTLASIAVLAAGLHFGCASPAAPTAERGTTVVAPAGGVATAMNLAPVLRLKTDPPVNNGTVSGVIPLTVMFNLCPSDDPDNPGGLIPGGDTLNWQFNFGDGRLPAFNRDGTFNPDFEQSCRVEHTYFNPGIYTVTLSVTDKHLEDQGRGVVALARTTQQITVGAAPSCVTPGSSTIPGQSQAATKTYAMAPYFQGTSLIYSVSLDSTVTSTSLGDVSAFACANPTASIDSASGALTVTHGSGCWTSLLLTVRASNSCGTTSQSFRVTNSSPPI